MTSCRALIEIGRCESGSSLRSSLLFGFLFGLGSLIASGSALALGFGNITVSSRLGANLQAEVSLLTGAGDDRYAAECFRLAQPVDSSAGLPVLIDGRLTVERRNGRLSLLVRSTQPVNEPVLLVSLRAGCGAEVVREYTVLLDAPEAGRATPVAQANQMLRVAREQKAVAAPAPDRSVQEDDGYPEQWQTTQGETALSIADRLFPRQPKARARFVSALLASNPDINFGRLGDEPLVAGESLRIPDTRRSVRSNRSPSSTPPAVREQEQVVRAPEKMDVLPTAANAGGMSDRLSLSEVSSDEGGEADAWSLRLSTELSYGRINKVSENQRSVLRLEYKLLAAIFDQANQQLSLAEQVRQLEASVAELKEASEKNLSVPVDRTIAPDTEAKGIMAPAVVEPPAVSPSAGHPETKQEGSVSWFWLLGVLAVVALLVWLLRRSLPRPVRESLAVPTEIEMSDETLLLSEPGSHVHRSDRAQLSVAPSADQVSTPLARAPTPDRPPLTFLPPDSQTDATVVIEHDAFDPVMELAEIMLAFGRIKGAIEALQEYVGNHPDGAIQPWMKLIEIYGQNGMRTEYEALVPLFQKHFNVLPCDWAVLPDVVAQPALTGGEESWAVAELLSRTPNLTNVAVVRDAIVLQWGAGARDTRLYLNALLHDKGNATYQGLSLSMVNEILYLVTALEKRLDKAG